MNVLSPQRDEFLHQHPTCMVCRERLSIDPHEILRGQYRLDAICEPALWLAVCRRCHGRLDNAEEWPLVRQVALKVFQDKLFSVGNVLHAVRRVCDNGRGPVVLDEDEVQVALQQLVEEQSR